MSRVLRVQQRIDAVGCRQVAADGQKKSPKAERAVGAKLENSGRKCFIQGRGFQSGRLKKDPGPTDQSVGSYLEILSIND